MANTVCTSFKSELLTGTHNFSSNTFKLALYTSSASALADYTVYNTNNEASGSGYTAGGTTLSGGTVSTSGTTAYADFTADATFSSVTVTARYALIYNSSQSNKACFFLDFGGDKTATNGTFTITFPAPGASALLTITG